jgi:hypothetical protein
MLNRRQPNDHQFVASENLSGLAGAGSTPAVCTTYSATYFETAPAYGL